jgi:CheY-like chemotaxis protein
VLVHRVQLEQIVLNLALNARDAMPDGGRLTFAVRHERGSEPSVVLSVSDTGVGMADDVRARIFEPFFSTKDDGHGTGLGLAIVDAIVRERGGAITVESAPKRGAAFHLRFPAAVGVAVAPPAKAAPPPPLGRGEHVLVVEDDDAVRTLATRTLEAQGYVVASARGGLEALEHVDARERPLDLVITDERMPRITGKHLVGELRRRQPQLRAILMSTHSGGSEEAAVKAGATFLAKPFTVAELLTGVRSALDA